MADWLLLATGASSTTQYRPFPRGTIQEGTKPSRKAREGKERYGKARYSKGKRGAWWVGGMINMTRGVHRRRGNAKIGPGGVDLDISAKHA